MRVMKCTPQSGENLLGEERRRNAGLEAGVRSLKRPVQTVLCGEETLATSPSPPSPRLIRGDFATS